MKYYLLLVLISLIQALNIVSAQNPIRVFNSLGNMISIGDTLYFAADDGKDGMELWRTNGKPEGTFMVKDIYPGYDGSSPDNFYVYKNELYFTASDGLHGNELWKTDGTPEGTKMFMNLRPDSDPYDKGSNPHHLIEFKGLLVFAAADTLFGANLWKTDGTPENTSRFFTSDYWNVTQLVTTDEKLFFLKNSGPMEMWQSDGTADGTTLLSVDEYYSVKPLLSIDNKLYLITYTTYNETIRLYTLPTGQTECELLKEFNGSSQEISNFTKNGNELYFSVCAESPDDNYKDELWKTDGTEEGTMLVKSFGWNRFSSDSQIGTFISYKGKIFFNGGSTNQYSLWNSDGTLAGTKEISPAGICRNSSFVVNNNLIFFCSGGQLWSSDGTTSGTKLFTGLNLNQGLQRVRSVGNFIYFQTQENYQCTLWNNTPKPDIRIQAGWKVMESGEILTFSNTPVNGLNSMNLTISNKGLEELFVSGISVSGKSFYTDIEPGMIEPGKDRIYKLNFFPESEGLKSEILIVNSNDNNQGSFQINLKGAAIEVDPKVIFTDHSIVLPNADIVPDYDTLLLSSSEITEMSEPGTPVGTFSVKGDPSDYTYNFAYGFGDADNDKFEIVNNTLVSLTQFDYGMQSTRVIRVKAENNAGRSYERYFMLRIKNEPEVISGCENEFYNMGYALYDVDFNLTGEVFAVGDQGTIIKSSDNGNTWKRMNSGTIEGLQKIKFLSETTGYILGQNKLLKTENAGATWFPVSAFPAISMQFITENTGFIVDRSGNVYKTFDGGRNWTKIRSGYSDNVYSVYFMNENKGYICGRDCFFNTTDGGATWNNISLDDLGWNLWLTDICFTDEKNGFVICEDGNILVSTDGGITWSKGNQVSTDFAEKIRFIDKNTGFITGGWLGGNIYKTSDAGKTWENILTTAGSPSGIGISQDGNEIYIVGNAAGYGSTSNAGHFIFHSNNSGESWNKISELNGEVDFYSTNFFNDGIGFLFGGYYNDGGIAYKTTDFGITWRSLPVQANWNFRKCFYISPEIIVAIADSVYITKNGGDSWQTIHVFENSANFSFISADTIYATYGQVAYKSTDGGSTWDSIRSGDEYYYNIHFTDSKRGILIGFNQIEITNNGGDTWKTYQHNLERVFRAVCYAGEDTIFIGGTEGVILKSTDRGTTWQTIYTSIPVEIISMRFTENRSGYAIGSNGGGWAQLYFTNDAGETWTGVFGGSDDMNSMWLSDNGDLYFTGERGSFYKYGKSMPPTAAGYITAPDSYCPGQWIRLTAPQNYNTQLTWRVEGTGTYTFSGNEGMIKTDSTGEITVEVEPTNGCGTGISRKITILPPEYVELSILGKDTVTTGQENVIYMPDITGSRNIWYAEGSRYIDAKVPDQINVDWGYGTRGVVELVQTDDAGCRTKSVKQITILAVTGTDDRFKSSVSASIFPNPAVDLLNIVFSDENEYEIFLVDESGTIYLQNKIKGSNASLNISQIPRGVYLLTIRSKGEFTNVKVVVN